jgi:hypothetical protein
MLDLKPIYLPYGSNSTVTNSSSDTSLLDDVIIPFIKSYILSLDWDALIESGTSILGVFGMLTYTDEVDNYYEKKVSDFLGTEEVFEFPDEIMLICMGTVGSAVGGVVGVALSGLMSFMTGESSWEAIVSWLGGLFGSAASATVMSLTLVTSLEIFMRKLRALYNDEPNSLLHLTQSELITLWKEGLVLCWGFGGLAPSVGSAMYLQSMEVE